MGYLAEVGEGALLVVRRLFLLLDGAGGKVGTCKLFESVSSFSICVMVGLRRTILEFLNSMRYSRSRYLAQSFRDVLR